MDRIRNLFNRLSVGQKVMSAILVEVASYTILTTLALSQLHSVGAEVQRMANVYIPLFSATETIRQKVQEKRINLKEIIFVGDRVVYDKASEDTYLAAKDRFLSANEQIGDEIASAKGRLSNSTTEKISSGSVIRRHSQELVRQLNDIRQANDKHSKLVGRVFQHIEDGSFLMGMEMVDAVAVSEDDLRTELDLLVTYLNRLKADSVTYARSVEEQAATIILFGSIVMVCFVISVFFFIVRRNITTPLNMLTETISASNNLEYVEDTAAERDLMKRRDEIGMLGRSFNELKHDLWAQGKALQSAKEEAERANRAKSQFLAAASHDLRQPLHAMQLYIEALRLKVHDKPSLSLISNIDAVSISAGRMLNALLDVSQLEAGTVEPQISDFPIEEVLRRVSRSFTPVALHKGLDLRTVGSSMIVRSDPVLLERMISNLVSNAIRYTYEGKVLVGCRRHGDKVSVDVLDTGPGIAEEHTQAIFDDFYQIHNRERDKGKGLGLGLSIVKRLAAYLHHDIRYRSELGRGTKFSVYLDRVAAPVVAAKDNFYVADQNWMFQGIKVLLVEDDTTVAQATQQLLEGWGCRVTVSASGKAALEKITAQGYVPDIVVADFRLPGELDGVEVVNRIQLVVGGAIPAIIITGEAMTEEIREISDLGHRVLAKPVRPAKLRALFRHLLSGKI